MPFPNRNCDLAAKGNERTKCMLRAKGTGPLWLATLLPQLIVHLAQVSSLASPMRFSACCKTVNVACSPSVPLTWEASLQACTTASRANPYLATNLTCQSLNEHPATNKPAKQVNKEHSKHPTHKLANTNAHRLHSVHVRRPDQATNFNQTKCMVVVVSGHIWRALSHDHERQDARHSF